MKLKIIISFGLSLFFNMYLNAEVKLPEIFTDNMVLQRDRPLKIWGWADKGESVMISFNGQKVKTKADKNGQWIIPLNAMQYGGPYEMTVTGKKSNITLKNILIGDVWVCSGQSNMEWMVKNTNNAKKEIEESNHPHLRLYTVTQAMSFSPKADLEKGEWLECNPQTIGDFSAVGYFFGRKLEQELNVPIGLINSSWGGTNIQTWMSWDLMSKKEEYKNADMAALQQSAMEQDKRKEAFFAAIKNDKGSVEKWYDPNNPGTGWKKIQLPQLWESTEIGNNDGIVWFRKDFELPASAAGKDLTLSLGPIDDMDSTYVNGKFIGTNDEWNKDRTYTVPASALRAGKNSLVIKVFDRAGGGGIYGKPEQLYVEATGRKIPLDGQWEYKPSVLTSEYGIKDVGPNSFPSQLYNAMINPIIQYGIKGGIWYQGESNAGEAYKYRTLFPELIKNWRSKWGYDFPFCWVQLANYMDVVKTPAQSEWAELREAQSMTLSLPATGQAVIIDIGEAADIHPRNKQDVGYRLALAALKTAYGKDIVYSGPVYQSMKTEGNKIVLTFSNTGTGLKAKDKYGYLKGFAVAGNDQKFVWAKASIEGDKVVVYSDNISNPVAVRYAWGNNPDDANLYNQEDLPASPFRTDSWKGITEGK